MTRLEALTAVIQMPEGRSGYNVANAGSSHARRSVAAGRKEATGACILMDYGDGVAGAPEHKQAHRDRASLGLVFESEFVRYGPAGAGWVAAECVIKANGRVNQQEECSDIRWLGRR